jgi:hypothetical protein
VWPLVPALHKCPTLPRERHLSSLGLSFLLVKSSGFGMVKDWVISRVPFSLSCTEHVLSKKPATLSCPT